MKKATGKFLALMLTVMIAVSCVVSTGVLTTSAYTASKEGKIVYNKTMYDKYSKAESVVLDSLKNFDEEIDISNLNVPRSDAAEFFKVLTLTHPELYYVSQSFSYSYYPSEGKVASIYPEYTISKSEYATQKKALDKEVERILSLVDEDMTDSEKALVIHDELAIMNEYSTSDRTKADIYNSLVERTSVCQGYALAYSYILSLVGIDSELVVSNSMNHMWNKVHIGNAWYNVDVTWDDPINDRPGHAQHTYFLLSDNAIQNLPSKHCDYTISYGANSTKYDNYEIHNFDTRLCEVDGEFYGFVNDNSSANKGALLKYDLDSNTYVKKLTLNERWSAGGNAYWLNTFMSLEKYNNTLYFNTSDAVYSYDVETGRQAVVASDISGVSVSSGNLCYGMVLKGDAMYVAVSDSPNNKAVLQYVKRVDKGDFAIGMINYVMTASTNSAERIYYGDANCDGRIDVVDATAIQKAIVGIISQSEIERINSDVNFDSDISIVDATTIQRYVVGLI